MKGETSTNGGLSSGLMGGLGGFSKIGGASEDQKFNIIQADCHISNKQSAKSQRPCKAYIEIEFRKDTETPYFNYLIFQNFYCHQITIKQFTGKNAAERKDEKNWKSVLKNYTLMKNPHYETDAQNSHIVGVDLFTKFERRSLKYLRIYMKQPSPNWLEYNLRDLQVFMKKTEKQNSDVASSVYQQSSSEPKVQANPFNQFKSQIKRNLKNMKKESDQNNFMQQVGEVPNSEQDREEQAAMARYHWTQEVPSYIYSEDVRRADLHYNVL